MHSEIGQTAFPPAHLRNPTGCRLHAKYDISAAWRLDMIIPQNTSFVKLLKAGYSAAGDAYLHTN